MTDGPTLIVVAAAAKAENCRQAQTREALHDAAQATGWLVRPLLRVVSVAHATGDAVGRKVNVLSAQDTETVYRAAHDGPLSVLSTVSYRVRPDPRADPATDRALWAPEDFLRYKAHAAFVRGPERAVGTIASAAAALAALSCSGASDPRALPMHVFSPTGHAHDLSGEHGLRNFGRAHGPASGRVDRHGRRWSTGPHHGRETVTIAGSELPTGFHWDVAPTGRKAELCNGWQVWQLTSRAAYANVSPNAAVRKGNSQCVLRWRR